MFPNITDLVKNFCVRAQSLEALVASLIVSLMANIEFKERKRLPNSYLQIVLVEFLTLLPCDDLLTSRLVSVDFQSSGLFLLRQSCYLYPDMMDA